MSTVMKNFADSAKGFTKNRLGIIALFNVHVYGFATLAVSFGNNLKDHIAPLIYFLVFFPIVVYFRFSWLVSQHHDKIYGPSEFKNEDNFMIMKMSTIESLAAATVKQPYRQNNTHSAKIQLNSIVELVNIISPTDNNPKLEKW